MSNDKHTPLPWWVDRMKIRGPVKHIPEIGLAHAEIVASYVEGANAAFIVKAVNSHKALVDALEEMERVFKFTHGDGALKACNKARAALKQAKENA